MPCRFFRVNSSAEFYSTAFSRIFDVWIIEAGHPDFAELAATDNTPQIFLIGAGEAKDQQLARSHTNKAHVLANIFHNESRRRSGPFMAVNCGALPDSLLGSELLARLSTRNGIEII
jgi:hypothetical protein